MSIEAKCLYCGEKLRFGPPWQHFDGTTVRVRWSDGYMRDDHVATPDYGASAGKAPYSKTTP